MLRVGGVGAELGGWRSGELSPPVRLSTATNRSSHPEPLRDSGRGTAVWVYHAVGAAVDAVVGAGVGKIVGASEIVGTGEIVGAVEYGGQWGIESKSSCQGRHRLNLEAPSNIRLMYITFDVSQPPMSELKAVAR